MTDFTAALRARIAADAGVAAAAGGGVHWRRVPQGSPLAYVRLSTISDPRPQHLKGYDGSRRSRVQADCMAASFGAARALAEAVIAAVAQPEEFGGIAFGRSSASGPRDRDEDVPGLGTVFMASVDLLVDHSPA